MEWNTLHQSILEQGQKIGELKGMLSQHISNQEKLNVEIVNLIKTMEQRHEEDKKEIKAEINEAYNEAKKANRRLNNLIRTAKIAGASAAAGVAVVSGTLGKKIVDIVDKASKIIP